MVAHVKVVGTMLPSVAMMPLRNRISFGCETCGEDMEKKPLYLYLSESSSLYRTDAECFIKEFENVNMLAVLKVQYLGEEGILQEDKEWQKNQSINEDVEVYVYRTGIEKPKVKVRNLGSDIFVIGTKQLVDKIVEKLNSALKIGCEAVFAEMQNEEVMQALCEHQFVKDKFSVETELTVLSKPESV